MLNRTSVHADPAKSFKAAEDFFNLVWEAHAVAATQHLMSIQKDDSVLSLCKRMIDSFVALLRSPKERPTLHDAVHVYDLDVPSRSLVSNGFHDAIREGDGDRVIWYWKLLMMLFRESGRRNYSKEAFLMILQINSLSQRVAEEIKWSRFVNRRSRVGCNVPRYLTMEHLNRRLKGIIRNMGANVVPSAIARAAKSIGDVDCVCELFEQSVQASMVISLMTISTAAKVRTRGANTTATLLSITASTRRRTSHKRVWPCWSQAVSASLILIY